MRDQKVVIIICFFCCFLTFFASGDDNTKTTKFILNPGPPGTASVTKVTTINGHVYV